MQCGNVEFGSVQFCNVELFGSVVCSMSVVEFLRGVTLPDIKPPTV